MQTSTQNGKVVQVVAEWIRALVDHSDDVNVESVDSTQMTIIEVRTARGDHGKVLGRRGRTICALRHVIVGISGAQKRQFALETIEPDGSPGPHAERKRSAVNLASSQFEEDPVRVTRDLLNRTVRLLVDSVDSVSVSVVEGRQVVVFEVFVDLEDVRRVIGIGGKLADALRVLLSNLGARTARRFLLEIVEPVEHVSKPPSPAQPSIFPRATHGPGVLT